MKKAKTLMRDRVREAMKRRSALPPRTGGGNTDKRLPHERDESTDGQQAPGTQEPMRQAARDLKRGLVDTDNRNRAADIPADKK